MNYRHIYHAGNFSDVFKHVVLIALIQSFLRKNTAFCYLETHAGLGIYDLLSENSQKKREFENGIQKIFNVNDAPSLIQDYLSCVKKLNPTNELHYYPGSPYFSEQFMRSNDRMILSEFHSDDVQVLKKLFAKEKNIAVHHQDGYQSLKAHLPPKEHRGLIFIDPPYEKSNELLLMPDVLAQALKRFETGVFALWYPIKTRQHLLPFYRELKTKIKRPFLTIEFCVHSDEVGTQLNGSGMIVVNPPWQLDQELDGVLSWLWKVLSVNNQGHFGIET